VFDDVVARHDSFAHPRKAADASLRRLDVVAHLVDIHDLTGDEQSSADAPRDGVYECGELDTQRARAAAAAVHDGWREDRSLGHVQDELTAYSLHVSLPEGQIRDGLLLRAGGRRPRTPCHFLSNR
jgi:hypothetical protein